MQEDVPQPAGLAPVDAPRGEPRSGAAVAWAFLGAAVTVTLAWLALLGWLSALALDALGVV